MPKRRSVEELKTSGERLQSILTQVNQIQLSHQANRAYVLSTQQNVKAISARMNETLDKQDRNLDKLKLTLAR
ncbi:hypothetical protein [Paenibacillus ihuae]|uniref:hypothetical protein n=1 Tax=Paenibacillus ihuae TaxID=1232431 RepID=UPI0006D5A509|nr:hypothetical protein [Paenibacillus ihuae]